jgi:hypothetical protein
MFALKIYLCYTPAHASPKETFRYHRIRRAFGGMFIGSSTPDFCSFDFAQDRPDNSFNFDRPL